VAIIQSKKSEGGYDRKQVARIPKNGIYGGMLSRYSLPKDYAGKYGTKEKIALGFVVTHDQAYRQLPAFSGAFCLPANTLYWDESTRKQSSLVGILYALCGGKKTKTEIVENDVYDYDMFIGRPISLFLEEHPGRDGLFENRVVGCEPADKDLLAAIKPLYAAKVIMTNEKTGLQYLASPSESYAEEQSAGPSYSNDDFSGIEDSIPF
jgi:hypothetical protein